MNNEKKAPFYTEGAIRAELSADINKRVRLHLYELTDSTNTRAKELAERATAEERALIHVFLAAEQTAGRGRLGRSFSSEGGGVYMSILTFPDASAADGALVTAYTAVALCRVLERLTPLIPRIKWVNDIYVGDKKLAGILTEGSIDVTDGRLRYSVTGIGVNVLGRDFGELRHIATDIETECGARLPLHTLAAALAEEFIRGLCTVGTPEVAREYRERSMLIGRRVTVVKATEAYPATVLGITDRCELLLETEDGKTERLATGEVSLRFV